MKKIFQLLLILLFTASVDAQTVENFLHTDNTLVFDNAKYVLGWSSHPTLSQYLQEYFPEGQSPEKFTDMVSVWVLIGGSTAEEWMQTMANSYEQRKEIDLACHYQTYEKDDEYMFDCFRSETEGQDLIALEFNVYRCKNIKIEGKHALLLCFYTAQSRGEDMTPFLRNLKDNRLKWIKAMTAFEYPMIDLK